MARWVNLKCLIHDSKQTQSTTYCILPFEKSQLYEQRRHDQFFQRLGLVRGVDCMRQDGEILRVRLRWLYIHDSSTSQNS